MPIRETSRENLEMHREVELHRCYWCTIVFSGDVVRVTTCNPVDDGHPMCEDCHDNYSRYCGNCERHFHFAARVCRDCEQCNICGCMCDEEVDEDDDRDVRGLLDYSANVVSACNAEPNYNIRNYGIELEFETRDREEFVARITHDNILKSKWACKRDGSLSCDGGVEVISIPMPYLALHDSIVELYSRANIDESIIYRGPKSRSAGTHVHTSRSAVSGRTIARYWAIWKRGYSNPDMKELLTALAGRKDSTWAHWACNPPVNLKATSRAKAGSPRISDHYSAVSCSSHHPTYETRVFSASTTVTNALRFLETTDMLLSIAEETFGIKVLTNVDLLLVEIAKHLPRYLVLSEVFFDRRKQFAKQGFLDRMMQLQVKVPRKQKIRPERVLRDKEIDSLYDARSKNKPVSQFDIKRAMARMNQIATPPPKGIYLDAKSSTVALKHTFEDKVAVLRFFGIEPEMRPHCCTMCYEDNWAIYSERVFSRFDELMALDNLYRTRCTYYLGEWNETHPLTERHLTNQTARWGGGSCVCVDGRRQAFSAVIEGYQGESNRRAEVASHSPAVEPQREASSSGPRLIGSSDGGIFSVFNRSLEN